MYNYGITCKDLDIPIVCPDIKTIKNVTNLNKHFLSDSILDSISTINVTLRQQIINTKREIDKTYKNGSWDYVKTLTNPYELVFSGSKKFVGREIKYIKNNICNYNPLSRSFFKMIEISNHFLLSSLIKQKFKPIKTLHLAEGPGGFIESIIYLRKKYASVIQNNDLYYGITLIDNTNTTEIPSWKKSTAFIRNNPNVIITTGIDGTGNLYHLDNIKYLQMRFSNTMDLVTADGGFDFSVDYNSQEYLASRLIYSEILGALVTLRSGGTFICKIFDILNKLTIDFLYILQCKFKFIYVFKPKTSRIANSEKYIVCMGFKGPLKVEELDNLFSIAKIFESIDIQNNSNSNKYSIINTLFNNVPVPFVKFINGITNTIINNQTANINYTIKLINKFNHGNLNNMYISEIVQKQKQNALQWCNDNNMPINK